MHRPEPAGRPQPSLELQSLLALSWPLAAMASGVRAKLSILRRQAAQDSFQAFLKIYLASHCTLPFSRMHVEVVGLLEAAARERSARIAIAAPRGHAKSTVVTLAYSLWCMLYGKVPYILIISETAQQAMQRLSEIRAELETNPCIRADFPQACIIPPAPQRQAKWRKDDLCTGSGMRISAIGMDCKPRGRKHRENRPGLIILDDVESDSLVRSAEQRDQLRDLFQKAVLKAGTPEVNLVVVGTILHHDSLLANLTNDKVSPGWEGRVYRAVERFADRQDLWEHWQDVYTGQRRYPPDALAGAKPSAAANSAAGEDGPRRSGPGAARAFFLAHESEMLKGTEVLWPERESYERLMNMRLQDGPAAFDAEKQNSPTGEHEAMFPAKEIVCWDDEFPTEQALLASLGEHLFFMGCDPSLGKDGVRDGDDTAIVTIVKQLETGAMYVLDADIRRRKPADIILAVTEHHLTRQATAIGVETNQFQALLLDQIVAAFHARGMSIAPLHPLTHTRDKVARIQSLQAYVASGRLRFSRKHTRLLEELSQFPHARHDDGPDALEMAVELAVKHFVQPPGEFWFQR